MTTPTSETPEQRAREWLSKRAFCCGYPKCDGDLVGEEHSEQCPLFGKKSPDMVTLLAAYEAECERQALDEAVKTIRVLTLRADSPFKEQIIAAIRKEKP